MTKEELELKFPKRKVVTLNYATPDGDSVEFLALRPNGAEYQKFMSETMDSDKKANSLKNLSLACVKSMDRDSFNLFIADFPACVLSIGGALLKAAGATGEAELVLDQKAE